MRIHVVRHGESVNNAGVSTVPDPPLTAAGLGQAQRLAACWRDEAFDGLVCSPLWRALQTAEPLLGAARVGRAVAWPALVEWNRSSPLDGHPPAEIAARFPGVRCDPPLHEIGWPEYPGTETAADVVRRADGVLRRLVGEFPPGARVVLVAHQGFDGALLCAALGADLDRVRFGQGNGRVHTLDHQDGRYTLRSVNGDASWVEGASRLADDEGAGLVAARPAAPGDIDVYLMAGEAAAEAAARADWGDRGLGAVVVAGMADAGWRAGMALARATGARLEVWPGAAEAGGEARASADALWERVRRSRPEHGAIAVLAPAPAAGRVLAAAVGDGGVTRPAVVLDEGSVSHVRCQEGRVTIRQANAVLRDGPARGAVDGPTG